MPTESEILDFVTIRAGDEFRLEDHDPAWAGDKKRPKKERKALAEKFLSEDVEALGKAQELLYASDTWSVLLIFQAMDAAGKDSTIKHVMSGINPQGCQVFSFKHPSSEDLDHNFLWRYSKCLPERGRIGIFNRSYYEEVLVVRVHAEILAAQRIPDLEPSHSVWSDRFEDINHYEKHLARNGTRILKFFLNLSKEEQRTRFLERLEKPEKYWKFSTGDLVERGFWKDYMKAYEEMIAATSTEWAPWHVIPADHKWVTRAMVAKIVTQSIRGLSLEYPKITAEQKLALEECRAKLLHADKK